MYEISWTPNAEESYAAILQFVMDSYPIDIALKMDDAMEKLLSNLRQNKHLCPKSRLFGGVRKCVVTKHLSFAYQVEDDEIVLIAFFDNRFLHGF